MTILDELAAYARERVAAAKKILSTGELREKALSLPKGSFEFEAALGKPDISFICECKKASPSKGIIAEDFPYMTIAREYEQAGTDLISVLTEPKWFLGSDEYLREIASQVSIPCLSQGLHRRRAYDIRGKALGRQGSAADMFHILRGGDQAIYRHMR